MDKLEESFMLLKAGDYSFLLPVEIIGRVADSRTQKEKLLAVNLAGLDGKGGRQERADYLVVLDNTAGDGESGRSEEEQCSLIRGILVQEVAGIMEVSSGQRFELPQQVRGAGNTFVSGAALLEQDENALLAYIIDPRRLEYEETDLQQKPAEQDGSGNNGVER